MSNKRASKPLGKTFVFSTKICKTIEDAQENLYYLVDAKTYQEMNYTLRNQMTVVLVSGMDFFDFKGFPNLMQFHTENSRLGYIADIVYCTKLEIVNIIGDVTIRDFRPLEKLMQLRYVNLAGAKPNYMPKLDYCICCYFDIDRSFLVPGENNHVLEAQQQREQALHDLQSYELHHTPGCMHVIRTSEQANLAMNKEQSGVHLGFYYEERVYSYFVATDQWKWLKNKCCDYIAKACFVIQQSVSLTGFSRLNYLVLYSCTLENSEQIGDIVTLKELQIVNCYKVVDYAFLPKLYNLETLVVINSLSSNIAYFYSNMHPIKFAFFSGLWNSGPMQIKTPNADALIYAAAKRYLEFWAHQ